MNSVDDLCDLIRAILSGTSVPADVAIEPQTALLVSGLLDSLTIMQIVARVEQETGVTLPESEVVAANFRTPAALWKLVEGILAENSVARR